jgi:hypothetical protein
MTYKNFDGVSLVSDINISDLVPFTIGGVHLIKVDSRIEMDLSYNITGDFLRTWKAKEGGVLYRDLRNWTLNKPHGKYVTAEGEDLKYILRIIDEPELDYFRGRGLIHGKIKDNNVMILRDVLGNCEYDNSEYIEILEGSMKISNHDIAPEEDEETNSVKSISLFD